MFRRKEEEHEGAEANSEQTTTTSTETTGNTASVEAKPATTTQSEAKVAPISQPAASTYRPAPAPTATPSRPAPIGANVRSAAAPVAATPGQAEEKKRRVLTVGNDILLKGEIATCDRLVIEGAVDAKLKEVHTVEIAENGSFKGSAEIEDAEISGLFEGDLVVRNRLVIYSTGKVRGKISYGEIEIERGGELTGEIALRGSEANLPKSDKKSDSKKAA